MKMIWKIFSWVWGITFLTFFVATLYKNSGNNLPDDFENLYDTFSGGLHAFMTSWMFGVFFVISWLVVCYQLGRESGWQKLAKHYDNPMGMARSDVKFRIGNGRLGKVPYRNCLKVGGHKFGLVLRIVFAFRFGNPDIHIPWTDIEKIEMKKTMSTGTGFLNKLGGNLSKSVFAHITLKKFPEQVMVLSWNDNIQSVVPETVNVVKEES